VGNESEKDKSDESDDDELVLNETDAEVEGDILLNSPVSPPDAGMTLSMAEADASAAWNDIRSSLLSTCSRTYLNIDN